MSASSPEIALRLPWWQRWLRDPLVAQLTQGVSPDKLACTLAVGATCSLFPFFGFTSLLNLGVGVWLRLNQPILQGLNQLLGPLQLLLIVPSIRLGEWIWRAQDGGITVAELFRVFREADLGEFLRQFGWAGVHALTAWLVVAPVLIAALYLPLRPVMQRMASVRLRRA